MVKKKVTKSKKPVKKSAKKPSKKAIKTVSAPKLMTPVVEPGGAIIMTVSSKDDTANKASQSVGTAVVDSSGTVTIVTK